MNITHCSPRLSKLLITQFSDLLRPTLFYQINELDDDEDLFISNTPTKWPLVTLEDMATQLLPHLGIVTARAHAQVYQLFDKIGKHENGRPLTLFELIARLANATVVGQFLLRCVDTRAIGPVNRLHTDAMFETLAYTFPVNPDEESPTPETTVEDNN